ncbi:MAG TPA: phosphatase PAP2 family protein [Chloroflexota bacterium]|nr:phosphatase PAP2 family protein [Chloroflexota bacterium]
MTWNPKVSRVQEVLTGRVSTILPNRTRGLVATNAVPHPQWLNGSPNRLTLLSKGGGLWLVGVLGAWLLGLPRSGDALRALVPSVLGASLVAEYALKAVFQRPRPWYAHGRAVVLQREYRSSFPSRDAAGAFAGAWVVSRTWPIGTPTFVGVAALLSAIRVYIGAHRTTDVLAGAAVGVVVAEGIWQTVRHVWPAPRHG